TTPAWSRPPRREEPRDETDKPAVGGGAVGRGPGRTACRAIARTWPADGEPGATVSRAGERVRGGGAPGPDAQHPEHRIRGVGTVRGARYSAGTAAQAAQCFAEHGCRGAGDLRAGRVEP